MSDPWAKFRASSAPSGAEQPAGVAGPPAPPADDPWAKFRAAPPTEAQAAPVRDGNVVRQEFDSMPWPAKAGRAVDDIVRLIANGATFGYADKLAGTMQGTGTEAERALSEEARQRAGSAGAVAEIGGAVATPVAAARMGASLPALAGGVPGVSGALARSGLAAAEGAGYGALDATGHDRSVSDGMLLGAIFGGAGNLAGEAVLGGVNKIAGRFNPAPAVPNADELLTRANAAYSAADNAGVAYAPAAVSRLEGDVTAALSNMGYDPALQPGAKAVLDRISGLAGQNVTFKGLDTLRKVASNGFVPGNASNNKAVGQIIQAIDDLVAQPRPGEVLMGNAQTAGDAITEARSLWSRLAKSGTIDDAMQRAELNAASAGTGWNTENSKRQALRSVAVDPNATRGFTPDETDALQAAIMGSPDQNALRLLGRLAPTGTISGNLGIGGAAAAGSAIAGPTGAIIGATAAPAIGVGARVGADRMQDASTQRLLDIIMGGGSASAVTPAPNAVQRGIQSSGEDLLRAIFGASQQQAGEANARMRAPRSTGGR